MSEGGVVRVGIVGAGGIVRSRHLPGLKKIGGVELVAVSNRTVDSARRVAQEWGIDDVMPEWRDLVARDDIDAVLIGTWPYMHCPVTLAALDAGKHVLCQARMALNLDEARQMLRAAMRSDRVTMLCPPPHGLKGDAVMRRLLGNGRVGKVHLIRLTSLSGVFADSQQPIHWRQDRRLSGRNVLTLGIYAEVIHRWLGHAQRVSATLWTSVPQRPSADRASMVPVEIPDNVLVSGRMESGAGLDIAMSGVVPNAVDDLLEVYGDRGGVRYNFAQDTITAAHFGEPWEEVAIPPAEERHWTVEADFIAAIREGRGGNNLHPDFHDGYKYMEFLEAVWQSHGQRRHVDLPMNL
jgi:predicted dehydrogenase